jgi:hypothetical protein
VALGIVALASLGWWAVGGKPPRLPRDANHGLDQGEAHCLSCHAFTAKHPRPPNHPPRDDCFSCHRDPDGALHPRRGAPTSLPGGWRDDPRLAGGGHPAAEPPRSPAGGTTKS